MIKLQKLMETQVFVSTGWVGTSRSTFVLQMHLAWACRAHLVSSLLSSDVGQQRLGAGECASCFLSGTKLCLEENFRVPKSTS